MATMLGLISEHPSGQETSTTLYHNTLLYTQRTAHVHCTRHVQTNQHCPE